MIKWQKVKDVVPKAQKAPIYLEIWIGDRVTSYRVNFRAKGVALRKNLVPEPPSDAFETWSKALEAADKLISEARFGKKNEVQEKLEHNEADLIRCEDIIKVLLTESQANDRIKTQQDKRLLYEKHLIPWLNDHAPYAKDLSVATWPSYKAYKRGLNPTVALENHVKRFRTLAIRAFELGLVKKIPIKFDVKKEDFREAGLLIPDAHYQAMIEAATPKHFGKIARVMPKWRDRIILGRRTGMRPGEIRNLEKKDVTLHPDYAIIHIPPEKEKRWGERRFRVRDPDALEVLRRRMDRVDSPWLFPSGKDRSKPMDKHLSGWHSVVRRAGITAGYTPHDLRHTYATEMFQKTDKYAQLCFQLGMSLETAQKVYLHMNEADTDAIADLAATVKDAI